MPVAATLTTSEFSRLREGRASNAAATDQFADLTFFGHVAGKPEHPAAAQFGDFAGHLLDLLRVVAAHDGCAASFLSAASFAVALARAS